MSFLLTSRNDWFCCVIPCVIKALVCIGENNTKSLVMIGDKVAAVNRQSFKC